MNSLSDRITKALADGEGLTKAGLARACGIKQPSVSDWISGRTKKIEGANLLRASEYLGVAPDWLATGKGPMYPTNYTLTAHPGHYEKTGGKANIIIGRSIPRLAVVGSMGNGSEYPAVDQVIERMTLTDDWLRKVVPKAHFDKLAVISGKGNSMEPTFSDGDLLLVDTAVTAVDIDGVYVLSAHNRLFIKSVRQRIDGSYEISSDNPSVKTVDVLDGGNEVQVHGRVLFAWNGRKL